MDATEKDMELLKKQLAKGSIQKAYRALLTYMMGLRTHFEKKYGKSAVSGLYQGYMDMTYFAIIPASFKSRDLKVAIVFHYDAFRFEAWLAARNRKVQRRYWEMFKDSRFGKYRVVMPAAGIDSIIECNLAEDFDISDPDTLTSKLEKATATFMENVEKFLSTHQAACD
jgi:hypothetical protein